MKQKQSKAERLNYFKMRYPDFLADVQAHRAKEVSDDE
jgi:hypothetical protein